MTNSALQHTKCFHCGDECRDERIRLADHVFCCDGCKMVFQLLEDKGLCTYYTLNESAGIQVKSPVPPGRFSYLDNEEIKNNILAYTDGKQSRIGFFIPSMHCSSCIWLLEKLYKLHPGIVSSTVIFNKKELHVTYNEAETSLRLLVEKLASIGYEPALSLANTKGEEKKTNRMLLYRLGVAGFCMGNIMLFSFPAYLGLDSLSQVQFEPLFRWLSLILSLPVFFFSTGAIFLSAIKGLRASTFNIDFPLSLGIAALFGRSVYEVISSTGPGFFDSLSALVFFLLVGRWMQDRAYEALSFERDYESYFPVAATVLNDDDTESSIPIKNLKVGQKLLIRNNEILPADSLLLKGRASVDYSFVTGEAVPVSVRTNEKLFAGGRQTGESIEVRMIKPVTQSYLTALWNQHGETSGRIEDFSAKVGKYFTLTLVIIAAATLMYWLPRDMRTAFNAFTAVLIVACPCVLVIAAPFAFGNVMRMLGKHGIYLRNPPVVEKLAATDTIVFDKTGTLTQARSELRLRDFGMEKEDTSVIKCMARNSAHPLSRQISALLGDTATLELDTFTEIPGKGLTAHVGGREYRLGSAAFAGLPKDSQGTVFVSVDGEVKAVFESKPSYRNGLDETVKQLSSYDTWLLSGDNPAEAPRLGLIFDQSHMSFNCMPGQKLDKVNALKAEGKNVMMIGDGLNDAVALKAANTGIAVTDDINCFTPSSDVIMDGKSFDKLPAVLRFSRAALGVVRGSFVFSLVYNMIWMWFAVNGTLQPLVAALLMPVSSITVFTINTVGIRYFAGKEKLK